GEVPYAELDRYYQEADAFVFASMCENMPNILIEAMAAGLPIVCSDRSVMPEVLGDAGVYCDPDDAASIAAGIERLYSDIRLRQACAERAFARAREFTWDRCARSTFVFLDAFRPASASR